MLGGEFLLNCVEGELRVEGRGSGLSAAWFLQDYLSGMSCVELYVVRDELSTCWEVSSMRAGWALCALVVRGAVRAVARPGVEDARPPERKKRSHNQESIEHKETNQEYNFTTIQWAQQFSAKSKEGNFSPLPASTFPSTSNFHLYLESFPQRLKAPYAISWELAYR